MPTFTVSIPKELKKKMDQLPEVNWPEYLKKRIIRVNQDLFIESIDYSQNKAVIERLFQITSGVTRWGLGVSLALGLMAALLIFNTVRIAISGTRQEIKVMHLVGADRRFLMGPFMVQGAIIGFIAVVITLLFLAIISLAIGSRISAFTAGFHPFKYLLSNFWMIFGAQLLVGVGIGVVSSWLAVRKYLR